MALLSGLELLIVVAIVGILLFVRSPWEKSGFNFLPYMIIGVLLLAVFTLSGTVFYLVKLVLALGVIVVALLGLAAYRSIENKASK
jgi:peptidoglycan/LPS O-acetylase OafA/YrhL